MKYCAGRKQNQLLAKLLYWVTLRDVTKLMWHKIWESTEGVLLYCWTNLLHIMYESALEKDVEQKIWWHFVLLIIENSCCGRRGFKNCVIDYFVNNKWYRRDTASRAVLMETSYRKTILKWQPIENSWSSEIGLWSWALKEGSFKNMTV